MNCNGVREHILDAASGVTPVAPELALHLAECAACAEHLEQMRQTMSLLDEWQAPEPSPYFDVRLQARLREEQSKAPTGWFAWARRPASALALTLLLALGIGIGLQGDRAVSNPGDHQLLASRGTAVADLQYLEKHSDLLQEFEALDVLDHDGGRASN